MRILSFLLIASALVLSRPAHARFVYLVVEAGASYGMLSATGDPSTPTLGIATIGGELELRLGRWIIGADSDFSFANQYSTVDPVVGNRRGTYLNPIAPMIGVRLGRIVMLKADVRFLGTYSLSNADASQESIAYNQPLGFRACMLLGAEHGIRGGLTFERVVFGQQITAGSAETLPGGLTLTQIGLLLGFSL